MKIIIFKQKGTIETFKWRNGSECSYWNCSEWVDLKIRMTSDIIFSQPFQMWGQSHRVLMTFVHRMWFVTRSSLRDFPGSCIMMSWRLVQGKQKHIRQLISSTCIHLGEGVSKTWCTIRLEVTLSVFTNVTSCITNGSSVRKRISGPGPRII